MLSVSNATPQQAIKMNSITQIEDKLQIKYNDTFQSENKVSGKSSNNFKRSISPLLNEVNPLQTIKEVAEEFKLKPEPFLTNNEASIYDLAETPKLPSNAS